MCLVICDKILSLVADPHIKEKESIQKWLQQHIRLLWPRPVASTTILYCTSFAECTMAASNAETRLDLQQSYICFLRRILLLRNYSNIEQFCSHSFHAQSESSPSISFFICYVVIPINRCCIYSSIPPLYRYNAFSRGGASGIFHSSCAVCTRDVQLNTYWEHEKMENQKRQAYKRFNLYCGEVVTAAQQEHAPANWKPSHHLNDKWHVNG